MIWIMAIALFAASTVGFFQAEKAKKKRKAKEKRIGKKLNQQIDFGSFEMKIHAENLDYTTDKVALSDRLNFKPSDNDTAILVLHHANVIGEVPQSYGKHDLFLEAIKEGRAVVGKCIKSELTGNVEGSRFMVSFEVKH